MGRQPLDKQVKYTWVIVITTHRVRSAIEKQAVGKGGCDVSVRVCGYVYRVLSENMRFEERPAGSEEANYVAI